jgi:GNAT superfamily N-acetyltransferase
VGYGVTDFALARRIEQANAEALFQHNESCRHLFPDSGAAAIRVAGGVASFVGADVPVSYAVGLGLDGAVTEDDIAQIVEFYTSRGTVPRVDVCPLADESLLTALRNHGFQLHWFTNVLARPLGTRDDVLLPAENIHVREARPEEAELWTRVVDEGFSEGGPMTEARRRLGLMIFHRSSAHCYLAEMDGQPVAGGALFTHEGYAALAATSVQPAYRYRGVHAALIRARLRQARELGCDYAGFFASPGSTSQRNAERHGFRLCYSKATMKAVIG